VITHAPHDLSGLDDARLAATLATGAGEALLRLRAELAGATGDGNRTEDVDRSALRRAGDATAQAFLARALAEARPEDAVLSEEATDDRRRLTADRVWIVDPLDGTREFGEASADGRWRSDFAVHVALWRRGRGLVAGAVGLPADGRVFATADPPTPGPDAARAVLDGRRRLRVVVSRSRPPAIALALERRGEAELVRLGSVGAKVARVLDGAVDAYVHAGGQHEWDSAAPVAVATAGGYVATRLDGSPLVYNQPDPWSPDLLVCHPALVNRLRRLLDGAIGGAAAADQPSR